MDSFGVPQGSCQALERARSPAPKPTCSGSSRARSWPAPGAAAPGWGFCTQRCSAAMAKPFSNAGTMKPNSCCSEMLLCHHVPGPRVRHSLSWRGAGWSDVRDSRRPGPAVLQDPNHGLLLATGRAQSLHPPSVRSVWDPESWSRRGAGPRRPTVRFAPDPPPSRSCHDASLRRVCLRVGLATAFCWFVN